jgi:hypothetical protein
LGQRAVQAFTDKHDLRAYLWRTHAALNRPLVYRIGNGDAPVIMTLSRVLGGGLDAKAPSRRDDLPQSEYR